jgi:hypothetical protein
MYALISAGAAVNWLKKVNQFTGGTLLEVYSGLHKAVHVARNAIS